MAGKNVQEGYAVLKLPRYLVMPTAMACELFKLAVQGEIVDTNYTNSNDGPGYKRTDSKYDQPTMEMMSFKHYSMLSLEEE